MLNMMIPSMTVMMTLLALIYQMTEMLLKNKEKKFSFECGFNSLSMKKISFSTNFLMLSMMFLIFDVEIMIMVPYIKMSKPPEKSIMSLCMVFVTALVVLLMKEWKQGSLEWNY